MPDLDLLLDQMTLARLEREALRRGMTAEALAGQLLDTEVATRSRPRAGGVGATPFYRRKSQD
ncbi:hypothetical protein A7D27_10005 [Pseudomonas sp. 1D4]|uniref:hypothetical protein n=1 Tax=Pseudomonadaceae TaxID=135621 RepID=UPI00084B38C4|nr:MULTISPECIES: hypothetical protein [Pseudomonas]MCO7556172.1 hypothetical protein [Pseudomonas otitidis]OEC43143.1 hypothetical protein A7D27_10005 [Pseudomonas sp. 1D4]